MPVAQDGHIQDSQRIDASLVYADGSLSNNDRHRRQGGWACAMLSHDDAHAVPITQLRAAWLG